MERFEVPLLVARARGHAVLNPLDVSEEEKRLIIYIQWGAFYLFIA
jgi:hypothetical protein